MSYNRYNSPNFSSRAQNSLTPEGNRFNKNSNYKQSLSPDFLPFEYSSPLNSMRNNDNRIHKFNRGQNRGHNKSFSPRNGGGYNNGSPRNFGSPYGYSPNASGDFKRFNKFNQNNRRNPNSSPYNSNMYFNESMISDPWEELEMNDKDTEDLSPHISKKSRPSYENEELNSLAAIQDGDLEDSSILSSPENSAGSSN